MSDCSCNPFNYSDWCLKWLCEETPPEKLCDVGYFYDIETATANVQYGPNTPIAFTEVPIVRGGISLPLPTEIKIENTGLYEVIFVVFTQAADRALIGLTLNDSPVLSHTIYGGVQDKTKYGQAFIEVTQPNSILRLVAVDVVFLNKNVPPRAVSASLIIKKICTK